MAPMNLETVKRPWTSGWNFNICNWFYLKFSKSNELLTLILFCFICVRSFSLHNFITHTYRLTFLLSPLYLHSYVFTSVSVSLLRIWFYQSKPCSVSYMTVNETWLIYPRWTIAIQTWDHKSFWLYMKLIILMAYKSFLLVCFGRRKR